MSPKLKNLLKTKQEIAIEINKLAHVQRRLTEEIRGLEKAEKKAEMLGK